MLKTKFIKQKKNQFIPYATLFATINKLDLQNDRNKTNN